MNLLARSRSRRVAIAVILLLIIAMAYPRPNTAFLFRNFPEFQGMTSSLKGSSTALFLDPSFFYRFNADLPSVVRLAEQMALRPVESAQWDYYRQVVLGKNRPFFWHSWWWRPELQQGAMLWEGSRNGNNLVLLFLPEQQLVYVYVQNT